MNLGLSIWNSSQFMPHGHCFLWTPSILWPRVVADGLIALSYYTIPIALLYLAHKRKDLSFSGIIILFSMFIFACGTTHLLDIVTVWVPIYSFENLIKIFTAIVSLGTAIVLWPLIPKAIKYPSIHQIEESNTELQQNISKRIEAESKLRKLNTNLEQRVNERTLELHKNNYELSVSKRRYEDLVNTIDGIVWEANIGQSPYTFISKQAEKILGYSLDRWLSEKGFWQKILHPQDRTMLTGIYYKEPHEKKDRQIEYRVFAADGRIVWIKDFLTVVTENNVPSKIRGIMVDITDRKKTEADLLMAQASALNAAKIKSEFLANMSHEIRTPLNAVIGMAALTLDTTLDEKQLDYVRTIKTSADALLSLVNDLLDFSKIEANKLQLELIDFDLHDLLSTAVDIVALDADRKGLLIDKEIAKDVPEMLNGDPGRILQILLNLLSNAVKFTEKGSVLLKVSKTGEAEKPMILFEITDTGIGMSEETLQKLFAPFSQADSSTARKFGGTGLGLSISQRLARLMGGEITVKSQPNKGSVFGLSIPIKQTRARRSKVGTAEGAKVRKGNKAEYILVVEDNVANQKVLLAFLEKLGYSAIAVANGTEAIEATRRKKFNLILMDCQMPEMDGYEATRQIRKLETKLHLASTPIIAVTAHALKDDHEKSIEAGMNGHLSKPISLMELASMLSYWLDPSQENEETQRQATLTEKTIASPPNSTLINYSHIKDMINLNSDLKLAQEVTEILASTAPDRIRKLREGILQKDVSQIKKVAHSLKSTCFSAGAKELGELCGKIENLAKTAPEKLSEMEQLIEEISPKLEKSLNAIRDYLKQTSLELNR